MAILDFLQYLDTQLFYFVNIEMRNRFFDLIMPFITDVKNFYIPFLVLFLGLLFFGKGRGRIAVFTIVLGVTFSDILSSKILKEIFARPRPFETLQNINQLVGAAGFSLPSSHAVNSFTAATMFFLFFRKKLNHTQSQSGRQLIADFIKAYWVGIIAYICAFLSAFSRIYVGVHYPFDALFGALIGIFVGWLVYKISTLVIYRKSKQNVVT